MAIMKRCCCFPNTRSGSIAAAVYSLIYSVGYIAIWIIQFIGLQRSTGGIENVSAYGLGVYAAYIIDIIVLGPLFITSIILLIGVLKNTKGLLIPYMVAITASIVFQAVAWFIQLFSWYKLNDEIETSLYISLAAWIVLAVINLICLLCVIAQYQTLRESSDQEHDVTIAYTPKRPKDITSPTETTVASYPV